MAGDNSVLVVGAGPTGLALACELRRRGVPCAVVEARVRRGDRSKAIAIWPRVLEILADLGAADEAVDRGIRLAGATAWSHGRPTLSFGLHDLPSRFPFGLVLPQYETEEILERRLAAFGGEVERGVACVAVRADPLGVTVVLRHSGGTEERRVGWVVGCDGSDSVVRAAAGIAMRQRLEPEGWIGADVRLSTALEPTRVNYFLSAGEVLHVVPLRAGGGTPTWRITMNVGKTRPDPADWPLERLAAEAARRAAVPVRVHGTEWVTGFRVRQGLATRFRLGRVLVAGDAAHVHSPAGAQGINSGLQDAANLGWKLARVCRGSSSAELLTSYELERRPAAAAVVAATDRATRAGTLRSPVAVGARDGLWRAAMRLGVVDRYAAPAMAGLTQRYRKSAVSPGRRPLLPFAPGPGGRLPNVTVGDARLWDLLPDGFCVLLVGPAGPAPHGLAPVLPVLRLPQPEVAQALRVRRPTAVVVRPDRYVALLCPADRTDAITRYVDTIQEVPDAPGRRHDREHDDRGAGGVPLDPSRD
ncbi:FAD-dependent monooxygenase [Micromonospora haikouensis]|uniref:FAD-dependent monooxygenase n=1 Tax=Micromonospora haikouensis TaxID=686309 RepID=UPI0037B69F3C